MTDKRNEFLSLPHKRVPVSSRFDTQFSYGDILYTIKKITYNKAADCLQTSFHWRIGRTNHEANGIFIQTGVDIVRQYDTRLPSLVAVNRNTRGADVKSIEDLQMFVIVDFEKYFIGG